jgi:hypothetical protein
MMSKVGCTVLCGLLVASVVGGVSLSRMGRLDTVGSWQRDSAAAVQDLGARGVDLAAGRQPRHPPVLDQQVQLDLAPVAPAVGQAEISNQQPGHNRPWPVIVAF